MTVRGDFFRDRDRIVRSIFERSTVSSSRAMQAISQAFFLLYFLKEKLILRRDPSVSFQDAQ